MGKLFKFCVGLAVVTFFSPKVGLAIGLPLFSFVCYRVYKLKSRISALGTQKDEVIHETSERQNQTKEEALPEVRKASLDSQLYTPEKKTFHDKEKGTRRNSVSFDLQPQMTLYSPDPEEDSSPIRTTQDDNNAVNNMEQKIDEGPLIPDAIKVNEEASIPRDRLFSTNLDEKALTKEPCDDKGQGDSSQPVDVPTTAELAHEPLSETKTLEKFETENLLDDNTRQEVQNTSSQEPNLINEPEASDSILNSPISVDRESSISVDQDSSVSLVIGGASVEDLDTGNQITQVTQLEEEEEEEKPLSSPEVKQIQEKIVTAEDYSDLPKEEPKPARSCRPRMPFEDPRGSNILRHALPPKEPDSPDGIHVLNDKDIEEVINRTEIVYNFLVNQEVSKTDADPEMEEMVRAQLTETIEYDTVQKSLIRKKRSNQ